MSLESVFKLSLIMNMIDNMSSPLARVTSNAGSSVSKLESLNQTLGDMAKTGAVMAGVGAQIVDSTLAPVKATFATRQALGELASLGVKDLQLVENAAKDFSDQFAGTTKAEFITAAYDIRSGISSLSDEGVAGMTTLSGLTAKATKSTVGEMTSLFATGYNIYKGAYSDLSDLQFGEVFSAGIAKSVQQFKTTGSGMAQAIQSLGASATTAQVPLEEQLTVLGMLQATMSGGEAGTKYSAFIRSATKGGEALGMSFVDANNQLLSMPEILAKLKGKFGETMDAAEKMKLQQAFGDTEAVNLIDLMYNKTGDLQNNIVGMYDALGQGTTLTQQMASAINSTEPSKYEVLKQQFQNIKETMGNSLLPTVNAMMSKGNEAAAKIGSWVSKHQELVRIILIVVMTIGGFLAVTGTLTALIGGVGLIFTKTAGIVRGFCGVMKALPLLFNNIQLFATMAGSGISKGFSVLKTVGPQAISAVKGVATNIGSMARTAAVTGVTALKSMATGLIGMARQAVTTAATALPPLIASVWSFTAALLANPITWVIIGIVALVAAFILLWNKCDAFRNFFIGLWEKIKGAFSKVIDFVKSNWQGLLLLIANPFVGAFKLLWDNCEGFRNFWINLWAGIKGTVSSIGTWFGTVFSQAWANIKNAFSAVGSFFTGIWNTITGIFTTIGTTIGNAIGGAFKAVVNAIIGFAENTINGFIGSINLAISLINAIPGVNISPLTPLAIPRLAEGGIATRATLAMIGEGKEAEAVIPLSKLSAMLGAASQEGLNDTGSSGNALAQAPFKKVNLRGTSESTDQESVFGESSGKDHGVFIQKLVMGIDFSKIKELPLLVKLLQELEDYVNANGGNTDTTAAEPA